MKIKTYCLSLTKLDIAFDSEGLNELQIELDAIVGKHKSALSIRHVPNNKLKFIADIWALGEDEQSNKGIITEIKNYLFKHNIGFVEFESYVLVDEEKYYMEITRDL